MLGLGEGQIGRYGRQIILPHVGGDGQWQLLSAEAPVVGAGGLGSPAACSLAGAGVGQGSLTSVPRTGRGAGSGMGHTGGSVHGAAVAALGHS